MKLIAYLRVSSTPQLDAYGPAAQLADIRKWAKYDKHQIVDVKTDDITGKSGFAARPRMVEVLDELAASPKIGGLVVANLGRLARELTIQEAILAHVWGMDRKVFGADQGEILKDDPDDPMRTAMRQMQGVFQQLERAMITKRLRDGRRIKAAEGKHAVGQYKFGTTGTGTGRERDAGPHDGERLAVVRILALHASGLSFREIGAQLDAEGIKPRRAQRWSSPMTIRGIVLREQHKITLS